ncbi:EAL domain-containing protein [Rheinheimera maricola]|uniref:EAL domain-containing protein n=1 Tax=Rheinheimera maricola TaxID=2793282 RepID=A0ABS7XGZ8_9GAMM|nr:EAL domain-containing protein [Rheinheimera maricola]MBZ9613817.1 EAL domain-containing protein [Rheinheimera maricola]
MKDARLQSVSRQQLESAVSAVASKLELTKWQKAETIDVVSQIAAQVDQLLKRELEVRHLVRVQGLVDHELAVGNRVFFESKLQHYLSDQSEASFGAIYIIQLYYQDKTQSGMQQVSQLKGCIDVLHGIAAGYADTVIARLSDTDLVLLVAGISPKDMEKLGDRMAVLLSRASCFAGCAEQDILHIGYAAYQREQTSYQILSEADMALKTAQLHGPNAAFGFVQNEDKPEVKGSVWWRSELNKALQEQRFVLGFQPVFSWHDQEILQHEVLVRLQSSDDVQVPAAVFLPMAYNCGLTSQIDQHVLIKAAKICAADVGNYNRCSVNISVQSLLEPQWWQWLEHSILSGQLEPKQLAIEISEHHLLKHYKQLRRGLLKLHKLGFTLIVDQVGLAIDNALYIDDLPLESVKLHPSVVRNIDQHLEQQLFVRGLIATFAGKSIRVLATGIELAAEWQVLQKLGIAGGQGFHFSKPLNQIITHNQLL